MDGKKILIWLNALVSIILVILLLYLVGVGEVIRSLGGIDLVLLALSMLCIALMDLVMSYRIRFLLAESGVRIPFLPVLKSHVVGMLVADFTPSRAGYFATAAALHYNYKVPSDKALLSIFGPQILDFAFKVLVGGLGVIYLMAVFIGRGQGIALLAGVLVIGLVVIMMMLILFSKAFLSLFSFSSRLPVLSRLYGVVERMQESSHIVVSRIPHLVALLIVSWTFRSLSWFFAAKSLGISVPTPFPEVFFYFFLQPLLTMLEFVPSPTIAGLGLSEGGATLVFSLFGIPGAKAATFGLLVRFKTTFIHLPGVPETLRVPKELRL
jgi:uncharacterized protein (TIRG00374 family)